MKNKLTDRAIKALKPTEKQYKKFDGNGLYLLVHPNGSKYWRMKYYVRENERLKERVAALGIYPKVSLQAAREACLKLSVELAAGIDPQERKQEEIRAAVTFEQTAEEWFKRKKGSIKPKTQRNERHRLEAHLYPHMGNKPIAKIRRSDIVALTEVLNDKGITAEAIKIIGTAAQVFDYAKAKEWRTDNPTEGVKALLKKMAVRHQPALAQNEVKAFFTAFRRGTGRTVTRYALLLSMLTASRNQALRLAKWEDIDFDAATWNFPAETMKHGKPLLVPLAAWTLELLRELRAITGNQPYLFPSRNQDSKNPVISENAINGLIRALGYDGKQKQQAVQHGFRSLMTDVCLENGFTRDTVDKALGHTERNQVFAAYARTELLEQRREMAAFWAVWLKERYDDAL